MKRGHRWGMVSARWGHGAAREKLGRNVCSAFLIIDAKSIKCHIAVDTKRLAHAMACPRPK